MIVEAFLDSRAMRLVISSEFVRKQGFKLKKSKLNSGSEYPLSDVKITESELCFFLSFSHFYFIF